MLLKKILGTTIVIGAISLAGCDNKTKFSNATVLEENENNVVRKVAVGGGLLFGSPVVLDKKESIYNLRFKTEDGRIYVANVVKRQGEDSQYFSALKRAIIEGSKIKIKNSGLKRFKGYSGLLVNDEIEFLSDK